MARITDRDLQFKVNLVNRYLRHSGSPVRYLVERRYGYVAIDEGRQGDGDEHISVSSTFKTGMRAGEAMQVLEGMAEMGHAMAMRPSRRGGDTTERENPDG